MPVLPPSGHAEKGVCGCGAPLPPPLLLLLLK
jgi:hypothetical protein